MNPHFLEMCLRLTVWPHDSGRTCAACPTLIRAVWTVFTASEGFIRHGEQTGIKVEICIEATAAVSLVYYVYIECSVGQLLAPS